MPRQSLMMRASWSALSVKATYCIAPKLEPNDIALGGSSYSLRRRRSPPEYIKAHARKVADVMTRDVITTGPDAPLHEVAALLERNSIKRVPIVKGGHLIGIVSRANLIQAVASAREGLQVALSDTAIRDKLLAHLKAQPWADVSLLNVTVNGGVVDLWGVPRNDTERKAIRVAAESIPGVSAVNDNPFTRWMKGWS